MASMVAPALGVRQLRAEAHVEACQNAVNAVAKLLGADGLAEVAGALEFAQSLGHPVSPGGARDALPALWRMLLIALLLSLAAFANVGALSAFELEHPAVSTNATAPNPLLNLVALGTVPAGGVVLTYSMTAVAMAGLLGGSYRRAMRDYIPVEGVVLFAYFTLVTGLVSALGPAAYLRSFLDWVLGFATLFLLTVAIYHRIIVIAEATPAFKERWDAKVTRRAEAGRGPPRRRPTWRQALKGALSPILIVAVTVVYATLINPLYAACVTPMQPVAVYLLSWGVVKTGGEKLLKLLLESKLTGVPPDAVDMLLFNYELMMSVQVRLLLLSLDNAAAILASSVLTALGEFALRLFFIYRYHLRWHRVEARAGACRSMHDEAGGRCRRRCGARRRAQGRADGPVQDAKGGGAREHGAHR